METLVNYFWNMDMQFSNSDNRTVQLNELDREIHELQQKISTEKSATTLNDYRLRLRFLLWKKDLLCIAYRR